MTPQQILKERQQRGIALKELRKAKNISQLKLSQKSGLSWPTITRIEKGKAGWSIDSEILYLNALSS